MVSADQQSTRPGSRRSDRRRTDRSVLGRAIARGPRRPHRDRLLTTTDWVVFDSGSAIPAYDLETGEPVWKHDPEAGPLGVTATDDSVFASIEQEGTLVRVNP